MRLESGLAAGAHERSTRAAGTSVLVAALLLTAAPPGAHPTQAASSGAAAHRDPASSAHPSPAASSGAPAHRDPAPGATAAQLQPTFGLVSSLGGPYTAAASVGDKVWTGEGVGVVEWTPISTWYERTTTVALGPGAGVNSLASLDERLFVGTDTGLYQLVVGTDAPPRRFQTPGTVVGLAGAGEWLVVADQAYGYLIARVGVQPVVVAGWPVEGGAYGAPAVGGSLAVLPGSELVGVSLDGEPRLRFSLDLGGDVAGVAVGDSVVYASVEGVGLTVVDPTAPAGAGIVVRLPGIPTGDLDLVGGNLWVVGAEVRLIDVTDPASPLDVFGGPGPYAAIAGASDVHQSGDVLVGTMGDSIVFTDVAEPLQPRRLAQFPATWPVVGAGAAVGHALLAKGATGLDIVRMGPSAGMVAGYGPPGGVMGAVADGDTGFLSIGSGAQLIDLERPNDPILGPVFGADWPPTPWMALSPEVVAQVSTGELRLAERQGDVLRDAGDILFQELPDWPSEAVVQGVALVHDVAYLAAGSSGVAVVDISDTDRPRAVKWVTVDGQVSAVTVSGSTLVAGTDDGWAVLDIDDALTPVLRVRTKTGAAVRGLSLAGSRLTVGDDHMVRERDLDSPVGVERTLRDTGPVRLVIPHEASVIALTEKGVIEVARTEAEPEELVTPTPPATLAPWVSPTPTETREPTTPPPTRTLWLPWTVRP